MALPTGTVTLLFSDIEGSTRLLHRLGDAYAKVLNTQRSLLRDAWSRHCGHEMGTEGDSFFVAFPDAYAAITAAVEAQRGLAGIEWPANEQVRVRIGLHTGTPAIHNEAYVGMDVHRAARIAAAAHGGQILVSEATAKLVEDNASLGTLGLGEHLMKDIPRPERLFQVLAEGLPQDFPPVRTLGSTSSLPYAGLLLVGRDAEVAELVNILSSDHARLVTLTGAGGSGKTRLAVAAAAHVAGNSSRAYFCALETTTTAEEMWSTIAAALGVPAEQRNMPQLLEHARHLEGLLVLDNLEQIRDAGNVVDELLHAAPTISVLATSRTPLHVRGEREHAVPPLALPDGPELSASQSSAAVQLFVRQAALVRRAFSLTEHNHADIAAICARLDGLPLALELAASRTKVLSPQALLKRLGHALDLSTTEGRRPGRQQTLRGAIDWSYALLEPDAQRVFRLMSAFPGGVTMDALEDVSRVLDPPHHLFDLVEQLADASLVTVAETAEGEPRFSMLNTIREFAADQLEDRGEAGSVHRSAVAWALRLVDSPDRDGDGAAFTYYESRMDAEFVNVGHLTQLALNELSVGTPSDETFGSAVRMVIRAGDWYDQRGYRPLARSWSEQIVAHTRSVSALPVHRAEAMTALSQSLRMTGDYGGAMQAINEALAFLEGSAAADQDAERLRVAALEARGRYQVDLTAFEAAERDFSQVLAYPGLSQNSRLWNMLYLAIIETARGNFDRALTIEEKVVELADRSGFRSRSVHARFNSACSLRELGRLDEAERRMREIFVDVMGLGDVDMDIAAAEDYAAVLIDLGRYEDAATMRGAAEATRDARGISRSPYEEEDQRARVTRASAALGARWPKCVSPGRKLSIEDAFTSVAVDK